MVDLRPTVQEIIEHFGMAPLDVEGGAFVRVYESTDILKPPFIDGENGSRYENFQEAKPFATAILFLLTEKSCSRLHRLPTDEVYHFYLGDPIELLDLAPDGSGKIVTLGQDILHGQSIQYAVQKNHWQGSRLKKGGSYALLGTTMAPGYTKEDFEEGDFFALSSQYPEFWEVIKDLLLTPPMFY